VCIYTHIHTHTHIYIYINILIVTYFYHNNFATDFADRVLNFDSNLFILFHINRVIFMSGCLIPQNTMQWCKFIYTYIYIHINRVIHTYIYIYIYIYMYACMYVYMFACMHICIMYVHILCMYYACMYVCIHVYYRKPLSWWTEILRGSHLQRIRQTARVYKLVYFF